MLYVQIRVSVIYLTIDTEEDTPQPIETMSSGFL